MNISFIGVPNASIEGRYNDVHYFVEKILENKDKFFTSTKVKKIPYKDTNEFDTITAVPYEKGVVFKIDNLDENDKENNNTTVDFIITETGVHYIITKAAWNFNRNAEIQQQVQANIEKAQEITNNLGKQIETNRLFTEDNSKEFLIKFSHKRQEKIQRKDYETSMTTTFIKLEELSNEFKNNDDLKQLQAKQEGLKELSDKKEEYKKQLDSISPEKMEILEKFSNGDIDKMTAIKMINKITDTEEKPKVANEDVQKLLDYVLEGENIDKKDND